MVVLRLLLFLSPPRPARYLQSTGIPLLPAPQLAWQGPPTAPVALANPFSICTHLPFPFPPVAQGFHPEGGYSGNGYIMAIISVLAGMDFPKSRRAGGKRNVFLTACDSGKICQSVLFFFTLEAKTLQPTQALCPEEK